MTLTMDTKLLNSLFAIHFTIHRFSITLSRPFQCHFIQRIVKLQIKSPKEFVENNKEKVSLVPATINKVVPLFFGYVISTLVNSCDEEN
jgi:hypothetical protein